MSTCQVLNKRTYTRHRPLLAENTPDISSMRHPLGILFRLGLAKHLDNPLPDQLHNFVFKPRPSSEVGAVVISPETLSRIIFRTILTQSLQTEP
ncbi:hypothetical protein KC19_VG340700 [Ceratodon purpureus]|uniref:Uncharacterized protein n=1 Tax=Ceratodon purpureus TaxID=3225 RepID=A0A8T0HW94_CERPU|nr:hypothetical protein KC19_VG340700 [Ceratodon purpureus]